jgi:hypothetical protein
VEKGIGLVPEAGDSAPEESRHSPGALMGKLLADLCGKGTLGRHKSFRPFAVKRSRPTGGYEPE